MLSFLLHVLRDRTESFGTVVSCWLLTTTCLISTGHWPTPRCCVPLVVTLAQLCNLLAVLSLLNAEGTADSLFESSTASAPDAILLVLQDLARSCKWCRNAGTRWYRAQLIDLRVHPSARSLSTKTCIILVICFFVELKRCQRGVEQLEDANQDCVKKLRP